MSTADLSLLERWTTSRDAEAFAEIVTRYSGMVYATCRRILRNTEDAEDVTQECFLRLARGETAIHSSLGGWLHYLATHRSLDMLRSRSSRIKRDAEHAEVAAAGKGGEVGWDAVEECVDEAIAALPCEMREALVQHFFAGATHEEIAEAMNVTRSAVTRRIAKGVELVRVHLAERGLLVGAAVLASLLPLHSAEAVPAALAASLGKLALAGTTGGALPAAALRAKALAAEAFVPQAEALAQAVPAAPGLARLSSAVLKVAVVVAVAALILLGWQAFHSPSTPPAAATETGAPPTDFLIQQH